MCGHCQVTVTEGELVKHGITSSAAGLSPPGNAEREIARQLGLVPGRRLGCHAQIECDVAIDVPTSSQLHQQVIRKPGEAIEIEIDPVVRAHVVEVPPPGLGEPDGDLQRLAKTLRQEWQLGELEFSLQAMQVLQGALQDGNRCVTAAVRAGREVIDVWPGLKERLCGLAIDVGSTTLAAHLCDLRTGELLASSGAMNPQIRFGEDLISRVSYVMAHPGAEQALSDSVRCAINALINKLAAGSRIDRRDIVEVVIVGNPIMHHLLLGISPVELGRAPFALSTSDSVDICAREIGIEINPGGHAYVLPCIAGHVGADAAGVLLAEAPFDRDDISLVIDIGTNAEILLGNRKRLLAASSPTGPAFEGAQISAGQRAAPGAIERVRIDRESLEARFKVVDCDVWSDDPQFVAALPTDGVTGICGSGIIEAIAEMYLAGIITADGRIDGRLATKTRRIVSDGSASAYLIYEGPRRICIEQADVRAIQLAKAALYAGVQLLMQDRGVDHVDRIRLAGAFGAQIDGRYAMVLGLIPDCDLAAVSAAGNAAGTGARIALLNKAMRTVIEEQARSVEKIETASRSEFQDLYVEAMAIPHQAHGFSRLRDQVSLPENGTETRRARAGRGSA